MDPAALSLPSPPLRLAVTGGIAEGKSTVVGYLIEAGAIAASADDVAREALDCPETMGLVTRGLGLGQSAGRPEIRRLVSNDPSARRALNLMLHPIVLNRLIETAPAIVEVPLLVETCLFSLFRHVWVVTSGPEEQLRRLTERLGDEIAAAKLIASQLPSEVKLTFGDTVVRTNLPPHYVHTQVVSLARQKGLV